MVDAGEVAVGDPGPEVLEGPRSRRTFTPREIVYIRDHAGIDSWGQIARDLGRLYPEDNGGKRSRSAVYTFASSDEAPLVSKTIRIPKPLSDRAALAGINLSSLAESAITSALKRQKAL